MNIAAQETVNLYKLPPDLFNADAMEWWFTEIDYLSYCDILADKGFLGLFWQIDIFEQTNNLVWTPKRSNQYIQNSKELDRWLSAVRARIEGVFHEIQNTGRNLERLLCKTVLGLCARTIEKLTSHLLRRILSLGFGIDVQTFQTAF